MVSCRKRGLWNSFCSSKVRLLPYLHNAQFVIRTDHKPLKYLLESPMQNKKIQLWALSMSGYNCSIEYIAGSTNSCADLLSRHPDNVQKASDIQNSKEVEDQTVLDVNDNLYEVNVLDSNQFDPKTFASCELPTVQSRGIFTSPPTPAERGL